MANIKIIDLPTGSPESTSFVEATQVDELAESGRSTVKLALNALGNYVAGQDASPLEYGDLETESTTLIGAANELHNTIGADAYDDTATYNTGDYCIYGGELYKCNDDNVTGAWDATKWDLTKVVDELGGGGGNADFIECTQAEYDAWEQAGTLDPDVMYFITDGQAGGGSLAGLSDVDLTNPTDGQLLRYNGTSGKWENAGVDFIGSTSLDTTDKTIVGAINELNTLSEVSFSSNTKLTSNGINVVKYGKFILFVGVFRGTTLNANETIFQLNNVNIVSALTTVFIPINGNFSTNYVGYLKAENSGTGIKIYTDVALDNARLLFVNGIIPIN